MTKIEPCPFCKKSPRKIHSEPVERRTWAGKSQMTPEYFHIKCTGKDHRVISKGDTLEEAISAWNGAFKRGIFRR